MNEANTSSSSLKEDKEILIFNRILSTCYKKCVQNLYTDQFVNDEKKCLENCALAHKSYFNHMENSFDLMQNPLYLKFY